ncbi:MAG: TrmH family RNA methyltransferase [Treponema sp.]|nr:TrmH family RNA methyltransferase [Treponema sp.]
MIPLYKLADLPRSQRLRKAAKLFGEAEQRFAVSGRFTQKEADYFCSLANFLSGDVGDDSIAGFPDAKLDALNNFQAVMKNNTTEQNREIRHAINTVYHLLLAQTGRYQSDWDFFTPEGNLDPSMRRPFPGMQVYLEDIRSPFNVGSMFRAAESFGVEKVWLSPLCANPRHKRAERTAMGCVDIVPWEQLQHDPFAVQSSPGLHNAGFTGPFFALETGGIPLEDFSFPQAGTIIAGSEELGVSPKALTAAEASLGRVSIPVWGVKGSLNVSVAFGIVLQAWADKLKAC